MKEQWLDIRGYKNKYQISNRGKVFSITNWKFLSLNWLDKDGYRKVNLCKSGIRKHFSIHKLVALHFIKNPNKKPVINHKDGNKRNNKASNLEWVTRSENDLHAYRLGLRVVPSSAFKKGYNKKKK